MSGTDARTRLLTAALDCFLERGVQRTTVEQIRKRADVSNGSLFHHFPSKQDLAEAVYLQGLEQHQAELHAALTPQLGLRAGIEGVVHRHLTWMAEHPRLATFLLAPPDWIAPRDAPQIAASSREFFDSIAQWLRGHGWAGTPALTIVIAIWTGPAQEYARHRLLSGADRTDDATQVLAQAAWNALKPLLRPNAPEGSR
ncbi:TetR/AcrR family transcriptional regulator [Streptomyces sp. SCL15-6]|jgi:AcrR family transcriptional regulator|uniref:TetR/AcrR family transcriptional regulator n=1 Tax=Streptomyces sp. SCL15-6 TaxID=2967222 RepID=UPI002966456F|nr:TetR/AcrR family transcriptional regulator [Streptomyces sp. SCL15-6]